MSIPALPPGFKLAARVQALLICLALTVLVSAGTALAGDIYQGQVERVVDGDTIQLLTDDFERVRVRLYGIDAPEKDQDGGGQSLAALT